MVSESKLFVLKITWTTIETNNNNNPTTQILKDFEKTIFLKLAPWTRSNFNLPFFLSETYVLNEKKINNNGIKNWNIRDGFNFPNFEISNDCDASENAISFCLWPSILSTLPVTELIPSSILFKTDGDLKA